MNAAVQQTERSWWQRLMLHKGALITSLILVVIAIVGDILSSTYIEVHGHAVASDLILNAMPVHDMSIVIGWLWMLSLGFFFLYPLVVTPPDFYRTLFQFSVLLITRSLFLPLTHLKTPPQATDVTYPGWIEFFNFTNDLFFSGHVAFMFLGFLVFRRFGVRIFFLVGSFLMACSVLAMHVHYSIDVFAAYFITYGTYHFAEKVYRRYFGYPEAEEPRKA